MPLRTETQRLLGRHLKRVAALLWDDLLPRAPLLQPWCLAVALPASSHSPAVNCKSRRLQGSCAVGIGSVTTVVSRHDWHAGACVIATPLVVAKDETGRPSQVVCGPGFRV